MKKTYEAPRVFLLEMVTSALLTGSDSDVVNNKVGSRVQLSKENNWEDDWENDWEE